MPEHHQGLLSFQFNAKALIEENFGGDNILELALGALESKRGNSVDKIINMPAFKIDSNIEATDILRMVIFSTHLFLTLDTVFPQIVCAHTNVF